MEIKNEAIDNILKHSIYYINYNNIGALIGNNKEISRVIPISHTNLNTCILETYLEILNKKLIENEEILGFYEIHNDYLPNDSLFTESFKSLIKNYEKNSNKDLITMTLNFNKQNIDLNAYTKNKSIKLSHTDLLNRLREINNKYYDFTDIEGILNNKIIN